MKRLILMGGRPWESRDSGEYFTKVLFRYFTGEIKLALCIFAQPETDWEATANRNAVMFSKFYDKDKLVYKTMNQQNFADVSAWADIIYIPGGDPFVLKEKLLAAGDVKKLWDGKTIAGSSAGADLFCEKFVFLQDKSFGEGLGWVRASCIPHWRDSFETYTQADWDWAEKASLQQSPDLPVLTIPEGEFVELTVH